MTTSAPVIHVYTDVPLPAHNPFRKQPLPPEPEPEKAPTPERTRKPAPA